MGGIKNEIGNKYGRLIVIAESESKNGKAMWRCLCSCGNTKDISGDALRSRHAVSCGCLRKEAFKKINNTTHGDSKTRLYRSWYMMKSRCIHPYESAYKQYGAKGISVCEDWALSYQLFKAWALLNGYKENLSIDRIENSLGYSPENCRWATSVEQNNNKTDNRCFEINGNTMTMSEIARKYGINYSTLKTRIRKGETIIEAIRAKITIEEAAR